jgi:CubicO group peptidase (beta-lactamase class C family)
MCYGQMNAPREWYPPSVASRCGLQRKILWMHISVLCVALFCAAQNPAQTQGPDKSLLDSIFGGLVKPDEPGFAVLIRYGGKEVYTRTEGVRDLPSKAKIDAHTNFRLASFTKQFTAMAVMLLVRDGKLRYEQTLTEVFPDFPPYGKNITIRNLLNHTGGLPDYEDLMDAAEKAKGPIWSPEHQIQDNEVLSLLETMSEGKFAPGTSWSYSNSGYVVLGLMVAKVSGQSYADFLHARIFAPLHMDHTIVYQKGKNEVTNRAFGHTKEGDTLMETDQSSTSATLGDGGIYSNLEDLAKWDEALRNHTLLTADAMAPALVPAKLKDGSQPHWPKKANDDNLHPGKPVAYGFGWFLDPFEAVPGASYGRHSRMWHTGSTMGFRTVIERFTEADGLTIIILCNRTDLDSEKLALEFVNYYAHMN